MKSIMANATADVVITMIGSLGLAVASRFVRSLRETGAQCRAVLLLPATASSSALIAALTEWDVHPHYYSTSRAPYANLRGNRAKLIRYFAALEFLRGERNLHQGGRVMLADSRDVIFQSNPFSIPGDPVRQLDIFLEDYFRTFANSNINLGHVVPCFGREMVQRVFLAPPRPVSCSGVTMGTYAAVLRYLRLMWAEMRSSRYTAT